MKKAIVITTINHPSKAIKLIAEKCFQAGIKCFIIGDHKTPDDFQIDNIEYINLNKQNEYFSNFSKALPLNHYARKNIGYLKAFQEGFEIIHETDDDNIPLDNFWDSIDDRLQVHEVLLNQYNQWFNVYSCFTETKIWPRGLPLEMVNSKIHFSISEHSQNMDWIIIQGLANDNPDVDAVYRLTYPLPVTFKSGLKIMVPPGLWTPFNSQNTIFRRTAFPLMYLPSFCSFRMTDIWRSFIAQRCLWELNKGVVFTSPTVYQERNDHNLLKDFEQEIPGYLNNDKIRHTLSKLDLKSDIPENLYICYESLIREDIFPPEELDLVNMWLNEFK